LDISANIAVLMSSRHYLLLHATVIKIKPWLMEITKANVFNKFFKEGFTVALFYCFMNTEVRHAIRYHVQRWKTGRTIGRGRRRGASYSKDWSPRSRTESIRLTV
ncbi:unnamed protein product, partial [Arctia plantaginis]